MKQARWVAAALSFLVGGAACGEEEAVRVLPRYERPCGDAGACPGRKCVRVGPNEQEAPGVCSRACAADADCGPDAACFLLGDAGASCLALCSEAKPCEGGLACALVGSAGERACFVEPQAATE